MHNDAMTTERWRGGSEGEEEKKGKDGFVYQKCPLPVMEKNRQEERIKKREK